MNIWEEIREIEIESYKWEIANKRVIIPRIEEILQLFPQSLI